MGYRIVSEAEALALEREVQVALDYDEYVALFASRDEIAEVYARSIARGDWPQLNAAILRRWSPAGLLYIKKKAWKLIDA